MKNEKAERFVKNYLNAFTGARVDAWNYEDGCVLKGAALMYQVTGEESFRKFVLNYMDKYINENGTINYYTEQDYNIDNINTGVALFFAYDETGDDKYRRAIEVLMEQLHKQPRLEDGSFSHDAAHQSQACLDDLYMGDVFYMMYESRFGGMEHYNDVIEQFKLARRHMFDEKSGLYKHAYDAAKTAHWADQDTGCSGTSFLRATGWMLMALIDALEAVNQPVYEYYNDLKVQFKETLAGVLKYQDAETGLFYQVIDKADESGNYLETSGSAMIAYAMLKACRLKVLLAEKYEDNARRIFETLADRKLEDVNGTLKLGGICETAAVGDAAEENGTPAYYYERPVVYNDHKGVGAFIMAYSEYLR